MNMPLISTPTDYKGLDRKSLKRQDEFTTQVRGFFDTLAHQWKLFLVAIAVLLCIG
ncbi:MAG: hypothetical protein HY843_08645, partial [Bdellovibrio sp.]|nr:hypothetical protein [Bdellovibrio sp.]